MGNREKKKEGVKGEKRAPRKNKGRSTQKERKRSGRSKKDGKER